ncbi:omptin family outer membrane protease [Amphritea pacifica]|uniref:Omptin family outer membrane protease n=1 Tax=Amphritea pacifica TaxID=2811233 RepID=A0ABS2W4P2_9GAMM|nr:omptin family outer membrane protease [Amphritea pacifica]MBN0986686.1 omptin family outer membrane protease [Amphritea pacifica]
MQNARLDPVPSHNRCLVGNLEGQKKHIQMLSKKMKSKLIILATLTVCSFIFPSIGWTMNVGMGADMATFENSMIAVRLRGSIEKISGQSDEYVYDTTGAKISELNWDLENIVMIGGGISVGWNDYLQLNLGGWTAVSENSGSMVDRDWYPEISSDWSDYSKGSNRLDHGYIIDMNLSYNFSFTENVSVSPMLGFRFNNWKWHDRGGEYIYSINGGWRNVSGTFPDEIGIVYEQWLYAPYLGVAVGAGYEKFFVNTYLKGSLWAWSEDEDQHLLRDLEFKDKVNKQRFIGAGIECGYNVTERMSVRLALDYQKFKTGKGSALVIDKTTGDKYHSNGDVSGIAHDSTAVSLSVEYSY